MNEYGYAGPAGPLLICYDGSEDAKHAIERAGDLLAAGPALVLTVWEGVGIALEAGLEAGPVAIKATGPIWKTIVEAAERRGSSRRYGCSITLHVS